MGSSLKVAPVANLRDRINKQIPQILINLESLPHMHNFDIHLLGYSDNVTSAIAKELGWTGEVDCEVGFRKGLEPWFWIFEGGVDRVVESEIEIESGSEMTADSNTDEEDLGGFVEGDGLGDDGGLKSSEVNETLEIVDPSSLKKEFVPLARSPKKETPKSLKKDTLLLPSSPKRPKSPNKD